MKDAVEIAKADALWRRDLVEKAERKKKKNWGPASTRTAVGGALAPGLGAAIGGASAAKHGHMTGVGIKAGTRSAVEGGLGGAVGTAGGLAAGVVTRSPKIGAAATGAGGIGGLLAGSIHGGTKSVNNSRKLHQLRPGL